jgi:tetraacyldisaccharide 4'-kinase
MLNAYFIRNNNLFQKFKKMTKFLKLRFLLFPFSLIYASVTELRNFLYAKNIFERKKFSPLVISFGNLTVGGTGKTPHVEYLIAFFLKQGSEIGMLSRGYGRKTRGVIIPALVGDKQVDAQMIGDEPMQIYNKFGDKITVAVGEKRALAIPEIMNYSPDTEVIILDDAYQHQAVERDINILLTDYNRPFYDDYVLPVGRLREKRIGAKRADIVIVTKCAYGLNKAEKEKVARQIHRYTRLGTPIFFTAFKYGEAIPCYQAMGNSRTLPPQASIILITGIANTASLVNYLGNQYHIVTHFEFADHFTYDENTVNQIIKKYVEINQSQACFILTTEKDSVKLSAFAHLWLDIPIFYLPIEVYFLENEAAFIDLIKKANPSQRRTV